METDIKACLKDIEQAINEINEFVPEKKDFAQFQSDVKTKRAVERNIEIIGEAVSRIVKISPEIKISNTRKIIDARNRIIHGYDTVSADILWGIVVKYLPVLKQEVLDLLKIS
ncbi:MAG: HepT-like ribonuclease domain-containing protein [Bacteroidota bacterium]